MTAQHRTSPMTDTLLPIGLPPLDDGDRYWDVQYYPVTEQGEWARDYEFDDTSVDRIRVRVLLRSHSNDASPAPLGDDREHLPQRWREKPHLDKEVRMVSVYYPQPGHDGTLRRLTTTELSDALNRVTQDLAAILISRASPAPSATKRVLNRFQQGPLLS